MDASRHPLHLAIRFISLLLVTASSGVQGRTNLRQSYLHANVEASGERTDRATPGELNDLIAAAVKDRDADALDCAAKAEEFSAKYLIVEANLDRAGRSLQALAAAEVHLKARHGALTVSVSALETRHAELGRFCRQFQEDSSVQQALLNTGLNLASKVIGITANTVGTYSAEMATIQGSVHDQGMWQVRGTKDCAKQLLFAGADWNHSILASSAAEQELKELEETKGKTESERAILAQNVTDLVSRQAASKAECEQSAIAAEKKIRELQSERTAASQGTLLTDCEVTTWRAASTCSKECMGGTKRLKRDVLRKPAGGAPCPNMEATVPCNPQPCLIDCQLGEWTEWSLCSAKCNGGYQTRSRNIVTSKLGTSFIQNSSAPPQNSSAPPGITAGSGNLSSASAEVAMFKGAGELACGLAQEVQVCNAQPCGDAHCKHSEWGYWGVCTKACGGGQRGRKRHRTGRDPNSDLPCHGYVTEFSPCKESACDSNVRRCTAKLDLVIMMSSSELLKTSEWDAEKEFVGELVERFKLGRTSGGAIAGLVIYGRWGDSVSMQPLTDNSTAIKERLKSIHRGRGGDQLENATVAAWTLLRGWSTRPDAPKTLVMLLSGKPNSVERPLQHMHALKEAGVRVVGLVVGSCVVNKNTLEQMVSEPAEENLFYFKSFEELRDNMDKQFVSLCPVLEGSQAENLPVEYLPTPF